MQFEHDGLTFEVIDLNPGAHEAVVLLHGFPQSAWVWDAVSTRLADAGLRVLVPAQRGTGPAVRPRRRWEYRMSALAGDVVALLDAAGCPRAHLVGHDWGGAVGWAVAAWHPDRVASLTSVAVAHPRALVRAMAVSSQALRSANIALFQPPVLPERALLARDASLLRRALRASGADEAGVARVLDHVRRPGALTGGLNWYRGIPFSGALPGRVSRPVTLVWGDRDISLTRAAVARTAAYVDGPWRAELVPGGTHWLPEQAPEAVAAAVVQAAR